jgi:hypothetical protein
MHDHPGSGRPARPRHLAPVPNGPATSAPAGTIPRPRAEAPAAPSPLGPSGRVRIGLWHRHEIEQARELMYQLAQADTADLDTARLGFTLGRIHGAALNLLDILDAITEPS